MEQVFFYYLHQFLLEIITVCMKLIQNVWIKITLINL